MASVALSHVQASYPTADGTLDALEGVDITIASGEAVSIIGPSGCGK